MTVPPAVVGLHGEVGIHETPDAVAHAAATWVERACRRASDRHGSFSIALAGGGTPRALYELLAGDAMRSRIPWNRWRVFFGDERACPPDDPASNYHMARITLLDHVPIEPRHVHRIHADWSELDTASDAYSTLLEATLPPGPGRAPRLDCVLLGLGTDGHTASLFPGTAALDVVDRWATRGRAGQAPCDRITLTFPALNAAALVGFLVEGEAKREALRATAQGTTPAARVAPLSGTLHWFIDRAAAEG